MFGLGLLGAPWSIAALFFWIPQRNNGVRSLTYFSFVKRLADLATWVERSTVGCEKFNRNRRADSGNFFSILCRMAADHLGYRHPVRTLFVFLVACKL